MTTPPLLEFAFELRAEVGPPIDAGPTDQGRRRIVPILGGTFAGPAIRGKILPGGADWQIVREDGSAELDARYVLETGAGEKIYVRNRGLRHGPAEAIARLNAGEPVDSSRIYFRGAPSFETAGPQSEWLTRSIFICTGERFPREVVLRFFRIC